MSEIHALGYCRSTTILLQDKCTFLESDGLQQVFSTHLLSHMYDSHFAPKKICVKKVISQIGRTCVFAHPN